MQEALISTAACLQAPPCKLCFKQPCVTRGKWRLRVVHVYISTSARNVGRDSVVDIATSYGLDGPGIESRRGRDFPYPFRLALGPTQLPEQWVPGLFAGDKLAGAWLRLSSSNEVKERVEIYLYCPSRPLWRVTGRPLPFIFVINKVALVPRCIHRQECRTENTITL